MKNKISKILICSMIFVLFTNVGKSYGFFFHPLPAIWVTVEGVRFYKENKTLINKYGDFKDTFVEHPIEMMGSLFFDVLRELLGDSVQMLTNEIVSDSTRLSFTKDEIIDYELQDYVNLVENVENDENYEYQVVIERTGSSKSPDRRFSEDSLIPVIYGDLYNVAKGNVELLDINFLVVSDNHEEKSLWMYLRNFVVAFIHTVLYIGIAVLISVLIFRAIQIMRYSLNNPKMKKEQLEALKKVFIALFMLIGSVVIEAICIYSPQMFIDDIRVVKENEFPIRVHVEEAGYSFSTNVMGFFRYMSDIEGLNRVIEKGMYTVAYIFMSWFNLIIVLIMFLRMLAMMLLAIVGPIVAIGYALNIQKPISYQAWVSLYVKLALLQILIALAYKLFLLWIVN